MSITDRAISFNRAFLTLTNLNNYQTANCLISEKLHHVVSDLIKNNTFVLANQSILKRKNNDATISFKCENKFTFSK
jgi:hypothetical protein